MYYVEATSKEIEKQAALASLALNKMSDVSAGSNARQLLPLAVSEMLAPYSAALFFAERVVHSDVFNIDL